jgi:hypothetical protein
MQMRWIRTLLFALVVLCMSAFSSAQVGVGLMVTFGPPPLPVYEQPVCPGDGYLWTPGFWAWDDSVEDYYWVPGTWVESPEVGYLWTPPYWGWGGDRFIFHEGYWGPEIGFYGGINYGFGYYGVGFEGGRWDNGHFFYNRAVTNVNVVEIHNVYNTTVINNNNHVSFNGGTGGVNARPTQREEAAEHQRHIAAVSAQTSHIQAARGDVQMRASENRGKPAVAATQKPGDFKGRGAVQAREAGGTYTPPPNRGGNQPRNENRPANGTENRPANNNDNNNNNESRPGTSAAKPSSPGHVRDLSPADRPAAPSSGNAKLDKKYQQQQEKQYAQQNKERQKLSQQQEKEDQKMAKQNNDARKQQTEQRHQQQTQQLQQKHQQQQQQLQQRVKPTEHTKPQR